MWRQKTYNIVFFDYWKFATKQEDWRLDALILKIVWKTGKTLPVILPTCINSTSKVCSNILFLLEQTVSEFWRLGVGYSWIARTAKHRELSKFLITTVVHFGNSQKLSELPVNLRWSLKEPHTINLSTDPWGADCLSHLACDIHSPTLRWAKYSRLHLTIEGITPHEQSLIF